MSQHLLVAREPFDADVGGYDIVYGKVKAFVQTELFNHEIDLDDLNTLRNLSEVAATKSVIESFQKGINALTVCDSGDAEIRDTIKLRKTRPYVVKDQGYLMAKRSVFNRIIGDSNRFWPGCVIGGEPQDKTYHNSDTKVEIGRENQFREGVTVNRGADKEDGSGRSARNLTDRRHRKPHSGNSSKPHGMQPRNATGRKYQNGCGWNVFDRNRLTLWSQKKYRANSGCRQISITNHGAVTAKTTAA